MEVNDILQAVQSVQKSNSTSAMTSSDSLETYDLGGVDCPECGNTGQIIKRGPSLGELHVYECPCMRKRRSLRSIRKAGMTDMVRRYTLDSYQTIDEYRRNVKESAERFVHAQSGWFFIAGQSGSGKTHICTAVCAELIERGQEVVYMLWRDDSVNLKAGINDRAWYESKTKKLKTVPVLYIDDFWKGKVTEADVNLAFEILNTRYNDTSMRTIISSELKLEEILKIDEAIGGRIYERSRGFTVLAPKENWRIR
ncbi:MAG: ATP-binding protein [Candidatus Limivicinus sp.]